MTMSNEPIKSLNVSHPPKSSFLVANLELIVHMCDYWTVSLMAQRFFYEQQSTLPRIRWSVGNIKLFDRRIGGVNGRLPGDAHRSGAYKGHCDILWWNGEGSCEGTEKRKWSLWCAEGLTANIKRAHNNLHCNARKVHEYRHTIQLHTQFLEDEETDE